jgi:predicted ester cyclase
MSIKDFGEKFIKAMNDAWQNGNFEALEALEDPKIVFHLSAADDVVGWEAHKQDILTRRQKFRNFQQDFKYLIGEGNLFALSRKTSFISSDEMPGIPKEREVTGDYIVLLRLRKGKVIEAWTKGNVQVLGR